MKAKNIGSGWHKESIRHRQAKLYGKASGKYYALIPKLFIKDDGALIIKLKEKPTGKESRFSNYGFAEGGYKTRREAENRARLLGYPENPRNIKKHISKNEKKDTDRMSKRDIIIEIEKEDQKQGHFYQDGHYRYGVKHYYGKLEKYPKKRLLDILERLVQDKLI